MIGGLFLAILFWGGILLQSSFFQAIGEPLASIPLLLILGALIFQRYSPITATIWFIAISPALSWFGFADASWFVYILCGILALFLSKRVFTSQSVYGFLGLVTIIFLLFFFLKAVKEFNDSLIDLLWLGFGNLFWVLLMAYLIFLFEQIVCKATLSGFFLRSRANRFHEK